MNMAAWVACQACTKTELITKKIGGILIMPPIFLDLFFN